VSFKSGYTARFRLPKREEADFVTVATSVIEGLNVFDVLTADRVWLRLPLRIRCRTDGDLDTYQTSRVLGTNPRI